MSGRQRDISVISVLVEHFAVGITVGALCGLLYFIFEPLLVYRSSHAYFGIPLSWVLFIYLAFSCVLGVIAGFFIGLVNAFVRSRPSALHTVPAVFSVLGFIFTFMFVMRNHTLAHIKSFQAAATGSSLAALAVWAGIAFVLSRIMAKKGGRGGIGIKRSVVPAAVSIVLLAVLGIWSHVSSFKLPEHKPLAADSPNIVLIVSDALRPDHLAAYGYARDTSPHLTRLAGEGTLFSKAYAHGNRTYYSMPSLFTSLYQADHGFLWEPGMIYPLPEERITLAEMLQEAGYNTVGLITNVMIKSELQMTQGFDLVDEFNIEHFRLSVYRTLRFLGIIEESNRTPDAGIVTDKAVQWLNKLHNGPFFLFIHYMDTHHAYTPPTKYEEMFRSSASELDPTTIFALTKKVLDNPDEVVLSDEELTRLIDLYDACVRYVDEEIGRIVEVVQSVHADRETIVIVTSDHGDEFMEHGLVYHNNLLTEELIRVPLIVWSSKKKFANHRVNSLVRHIDVLPTVADWVGIDPPNEVRGISLLPLIDGTEKEFNLELIAEGAESTCLIHNNWKILHVDSTDSYYLYDLSVDSLGLTDVSQKYPEHLSLMKTKLREYLDVAEKSADEQQKPMSPEMIKQLKALGYL